LDGGAWIIAGAGVGAAAVLASSYVERSFRTRRELVAAAAEWLAAAEAFSMIAQRDAALSTGPSIPAAAAIDRALEAAVNVIGRGRVEGLRMIVHRSHVQRVDAVVDRLLLATTKLVLAAPRPLVNRLSPHIATLFASTSNPGDPELARKWNEEGRANATRLLWLWTRPAWLHPLLRVRSLLSRPPTTEPVPPEVDDP
jgi:hypothetical protein